MKYILLERPLGFSWNCPSCSRAGIKNVNRTRCENDNRWAKPRESGNQRWREKIFSRNSPPEKGNLTQTLNLPNCIPKNIFKTFELVILWIFGKKFRGFLSRLKRIWQGILDGYLVGNLASCNAMTLWFGPNELGHASHIYFSIILAGESHLFSKRRLLPEGHPSKDYKTRAFFRSALSLTLHTLGWIKSTTNRVKRSNFPHDHNLDCLGSLS